MSERELKLTNSADDFDPSALRLGQNFTEIVGVKKKLVTVPVRKPTRQEFVRVHPGEDYRLETALLELKAEREVYLVARELWPELSGEIVPKVLYLALNRQRVLSIWPIRLPHESGRLDEWNLSAHSAARRAMTHWVRIASNRHLGAYEIFDAAEDAGEPEWPDVTFHEILKIAFKGKFINSLDHAVLRSLRGEA